MLKTLVAIGLISCCVSCNQNSSSETDVDELTWVEKEYRIEDLIFEFQEMILPEMFELEKGVEKQSWLCLAMTWGEFKVKTPDSINSDTKFFKCRKEPGPITPGIYFCTLIKTANSDGEFCKESWASLDWSEKILTNYSDIRCAQLMLEFVDEALLDKKMNKRWQLNKPHWIKAVKRIANSAE